MPEFLKRLVRNYGARTLALFALTHFGIKGLALGLANGLSLPFFQQVLGVNSNVRLQSRAVALLYTCRAHPRPTGLSRLHDPGSAALGHKGVFWVPERRRAAGGVHQALLSHHRMHPAQRRRRRARECAGNYGQGRGRALLHGKLGHLHH